MVITLFLPLQATTTFPLIQMSQNYAYQNEKKHQETDSFSYIFTESSIFLSKICNWMIFFSNFA